MKSFIVHNQEGGILRIGTCQDIDLLLQAQKGEFVIEGTADCIKQKIVDEKLVDKTQEEIEAASPKYPKIPEGEEFIQITKGQWQDVLDRLNILERTNPTELIS